MSAGGELGKFLSGSAYELRLIQQRIRPDSQRSGVDLPVHRQREGVGVYPTCVSNSARQCFWRSLRRAFSLI